MSDIFHANMDRYQNASRSEKTFVTRSVLDELLSNGARFLKRIDGKEDLWEKIGPADALNKVGHGIRDLLSAREEGKLRPKFIKLGMVKPGDDDDKDSDSARLNRKEQHPRQSSPSELHPSKGSLTGLQQQEPSIQNFSAPGLQGSSQVPGGSSALLQGGGGMASGLSLQLMLAARQQAEAEAAVFGSSSGQQTQPLQGLAGIQPQSNPTQQRAREMLMLREKERQRQNRLLG